MAVGRVLHHTDRRNGAVALRGVPPRGPQGRAAPMRPSVKIGEYDTVAPVKGA